MLAAGLTGPLRYGPDGERLGDEVTVFVASYAPPPRMLVFGAIDFAAALARQGAFLGYRVTVCDARPVFATSPAVPRRRGGRRLAAPLPDRRDRGRPGRRPHGGLRADPRPEVRRSGAARWRWSGSSPTSARWVPGAPTTTGSTGLLEAGLPEAQLERLHSPIGLDLGARTPEETAVSITAEIIADRWGGAGRRLSTLDGSIHENLD